MCVYQQFFHLSLLLSKLHEIFLPFYSGQPLTSRMKQQQNGRLLILNYLELSDAANYSCTATNLYGQDAITYQLLVKRKLTIYH